MAQAPGAASGTRSRKLRVLSPAGFPALCSSASRTGCRRCAGGNSAAPAGRVETAEAITLAGFVTQQALAEITLLKLDIEGAEEAVLRESEAVLDRVRHLVLEIHPALVDENWIMRTVERHFPFVHRIPS